MTTKHTPGPWELEAATEQIIGGDGNTVVYETNTNSADISLLAAAPDLLAALQSMLQAVRKITAEYPTGYDGSVCEELAERAIEKATGAPA